MPLHDYYILQFLILLTFKHFICDFVLQDAEMAESKGVYLNKLGLSHSIHHMIGTFIVCVLFLNPMWAIMLSAVDFFIHYHIDWIKMKFGPRSYRDKHYWVWFGADQFMHQLTYILLIILAISNGQSVDFKI